MAIDIDGVYAKVGRIIDSASRMAEDLATREFAGEAEEGRVRATVSGAGALLEITFRPRATLEIDNISPGEAVVLAVNRAEDLAERQRLGILRQHRPFGMDPEAFLRDPTSFVPDLPEWCPKDGA